GRYVEFRLQPLDQLARLGVIRIHPKRFPAHLERALFLVQGIVVDGEIVKRLAVVRRKRDRLSKRISGLVGPTELGKGYTLKDEGFAVRRVERNGSLQQLSRLRILGRLYRLNRPFDEFPCLLVCHTRPLSIYSMQAQNIDI